MSHQPTMSSCEEEDDEDCLDNGKHSGPQQEDMDQRILGWLWHCHLDGAQEELSVQVLSFLCCAPKAMCAFSSSAECLHVMRMFCCLGVYCCALSIYRRKRNPDRTFPYMLLRANIRGLKFICILGPSLSSKLIT